MIGTVIANVAAKKVIGTILKTVGIGALAGASFYGGVKGAKEIDKLIKAKKAENEALHEEEPVAEETATEETPVEETVEETAEETVAEEETSESVAEEPVSEE